VTPLQTFFLVSSMAILALGWLKGGHAERQVVLFILLAYVFSLLMQDVHWGRQQTGVMAVDTVFLIAIFWMSLRHDRWWLLFAVACQIMAIVTHVTLWLDLGITPRSNAVTRWLFGLLLLYALAAGVLERWLAGERAASPGLGPQPTKPG